MRALRLVLGTTLILVWLLVTLLAGAFATFDTVMTVGVFGGFGAVGTALALILGRDS